MKLKCPKGIPGINIAAVEYVADAAGVVEINDPAHVAVAMENGFTEVAKPAVLPGLAPVLTN